MELSGSASAEQGTGRPAGQGVLEASAEGSTGGGGEAALPPGGVSPHHSAKSSTLTLSWGTQRLEGGPSVLALSSTSSSTGRGQGGWEGNPIIGLGRDPKTRNLGL